MNDPAHLERSVLRVAHVVRAIHAATGAPIGRVDARWAGPPPPAHHITVHGSTVVVSIDERALPPAGGAPGHPVSPPTLRLMVADPPVARRLVAPEVEVVLDTMEREVRFAPVPMRLVVRLIRAGDGPAGGPATGRIVEARGSDASRVPLPEEAETPGTYRSAAREWTAPFNPLELLVGDTLVRRTAIDFARTETRVTVVDPT